MLVTGFGEGGAPTPLCFLDTARVDHAAGGASRTKPAGGLCHLLCQVPPPRARISSEPLHEGALPPLRRLAQTFSPNAISATAIFAAVCEGYLGVMPHWDLWLHLYRGELFRAPGGAAGVRKLVRVGCLNLVQKMGHAAEPREYIPIGLTSNHAQWVSQWFYLRNDDGLFPVYTKWLILERLDNWNYGAVKTLQAWLSPPS